MRARLELLEAAVLARGTGVPRARRRSPKVSLQDEDSVEDEDEDEDERTVGGTPVVEACADACEESAPSSMMEVFGQEVAESVYGRAVGSSLALALELGAGSFARRAHVSVQLAGSVLLIVGQIVTCLSVPSAAEFLAQAFFRGRRLNARVDSDLYFRLEQQSGTHVRCLDVSDDIYIERERALQRARARSPPALQNTSR